MSYVRFAMLLLVAGCRSIFGIHDPAVATDDANIDAASDGTDGSGCASFSSLFDTCTLPPGVVMPGSATAYSTDTGAVTVGGVDVPMPNVMVATEMGSIDVVSVTSFVQDADGILRITGALPVAFAVAGEVEIPGRIDVSAGGAGAGCDVNGTGVNGVVQTNAGDGGGGGGNVELGGNGGGGDNHPTVTHGGVAQPAGLHGGCAGGHGGDATSGAGLGGGAFYLVAASPIVITGVIDASGGGGKGAGVPHGGGAGGGAGGLLMLEASGVDVEGQIDATGGGGGGGADTFAAGVAGKLGSAGGNGGNGSSGNPGGRGGNGVASATAGTMGLNAAGGGGGGGGMGRITITSPGFMNAGSVAPPPS
jgi:hypothetical protein